MRWVLGLIGTRIDDPSISVNIIEFYRPDCLEEITNLGLTLAERKQLLVLVRQENVDRRGIAAPSPKVLPHTVV